MKEIQAIILDLGGVLLNLDYHLTERAFQQLGITNFHEIYTQQGPNQVFNDYESGRISSGMFLEALKKESPNPLTDSQITTAWNAMLLDFPTERINLLKNLKKQYRLFLLSNTNEIHLQAFNKKIQDGFGVPSLDEFFHKTYYSHLIGQRKPDREAFEVVIKDQRLKPENTIFIDDTLVNVEGGLEVGLQAYWLKSPQTVQGLLEKLLPAKNG